VSSGVSTQTGRNQGSFSAGIGDPLPVQLMRENALLAPSRAGARCVARAYDGTIVPEAVDTMWAPT
jgi:hypothetical protein